jgi:hypothetical protein
MVSGRRKSLLPCVGPYLLISSLPLNYPCWLSIRAADAVVSLTAIPSRGRRVLVSTR